MSQAHNTQSHAQFVTQCAGRAAQCHVHVDAAVTDGWPGRLWYTASRWAWAGSMARTGDSPKAISHAAARHIPYGTAGEEKENVKEIKPHSAGIPAQNLNDC